MENYQCKGWAYDPVVYCILEAPTCYETNYKECCTDKKFCPTYTPWYLFYLAGWLPVVFTLLAVFVACVVMKRKERQRMPRGNAMPGNPGIPGTTTGGTETDYFGVPTQQ